MATDEQEAQYKARLIALTCPENDTTHDHITNDAYSLYSHLSRSAKAKSIFSQPESPEAQELISIVKFYLNYFSSEHVYDPREDIASTVVEFGYWDDEIVSYLNPWFKLFFNLKKTNTSLEELQQWLFEAGFDQPFSEYNKKELTDRLTQPHENIGYYYEFIIVENLFGARIRTINIREPDEDGIARFTADLLNTLQPPLNIKDVDEIWEEAKINAVVPTLVAKRLLGYELEVPEEKFALTRFSYNNQVYGFYHSNVTVSHMFIAMRNIDCFLSYINRPERIFVFTPYDAEGVLFVLTEPEKFKKLADKIGFYYNDTEAEAADQNYDYNLPPSLSTLQFQAVEKPKPAPAPVAKTVNPGDQRLSQRQSAVIDKAADATFSGLHWAIRAFIAFILFFAAKDAISALRSMTTMLPAVGGIRQTIWMLTPYFVLAGALIRNTMFSTGYLCAVSVFVSLFSLGVYGMVPSHNAVTSDANVFIWVPLVQLLWIFGCYYVLRNR